MSRIHTNVRTMRIEGSAALVTGAGNGIGQACVSHLLSAGARVTAVDVNGNALAALGAACADAQLLLVECDVCNDAQMAAAFDKHVAKWGTLDIAILNAGIGEAGDMFDDQDAYVWQRTLDVDLRAVLVGTRLAARCMVRSPRPSAILSVSSAAGVFTMAQSPVYSAAKGGLMCPQFVDTDLVASLGATAKAYVHSLGALLTPARVADEIVALLRAGEAGTVRVLLQDSRTFNWEPSVRHALRAVTQQGAAVPRASSSDPAASPANVGDDAVPPAPLLPRAYRAWQVQRLHSDFRSAASLVTLALPRDFGKGELRCAVLVRRVFAGVNASDVNFTSGRYHASSKAAEAELPFTAGFESVGVAVAAGPDAGIRAGQPVAALTYGGFAEYGIESAAHLLPVRSPSASTVALLTSGLTASLALEHALGVRLRPRESEAMGGPSGSARRVILVTAAAGGTGLFAVQLARLAGLHVVGTCGGSAKAALLQRVGVHRVVDYKAESLRQVLKTEYPGGVHLVYESVGGDMFATAVNALAPRGTVAIIGMMSQYGDGWPASEHKGLCEKLLAKSASLTGFFLPHYAAQFKAHLRMLTGLHESGTLQVFLDKREFHGIEAVPDAVQHLQSGASSGKVVVRLAGSTSTSKL